MPCFYLEPYTVQNKTFQFLAVQGTVLEGKSWNETHVSGGGGGGAMLEGMGSFHQDPIHSSVVTRNEFWLEVEKGNEKDVHVSDVRFPIRPGHCVTVVYGEYKGANAAYPVLLINHATGNFTTVASNIGYTLDDAKLRKSAMHFGKSLVGGLLSFGLAGVIAGVVKGKAKGREALINDLTDHIVRVGRGITPPEVTAA